MRTNVVFCHPAPYIPVSEGVLGDNDIVSIQGADWFVTILRKIPELEVDPNLCQEDWGVVVFVRKNRQRFWVGLSFINEDDEWVSHLHYGVLSVFQRFTVSGKREYRNLVLGLHDAFSNDPEVTKIVWYEDGLSPQTAGPEP